MQNVKGKKVFVGLSGGVDSAVSAALLAEGGAEVVGVFIKGWYPPELPCTWAEDRRDAMRVAAHLGIPFVTLNASKEYKESVIDYLLSEYRAGRTPNPDIFCNRDIKFGVFYQYAMAHGADFIATGHYRSGEKDQTYFLWAVPKEVLAKTIFPVGDMDKKDVRNLARRLDLPVADKPDSQGICFLGSVSVEEFLKAELGSDNPALLYTIGQRKDGAYVVSKDVAAKTVTTSPLRAPTDLSPIPFITPNWFLEPEQATGALLRYRGREVGGQIQGAAFIPSELPEEVPVPGQSIVFYHGSHLVGGGIIQ